MLALDFVVHDFLEDRVDEMKYELLAEINGRMEAELLESYLEANGVDVELFQESMEQNIYPTAMDAMSCVQIFVEKAKMNEALLLMEELNK
jgi:hypothetical protein